MSAIDMIGKTIGDLTVLGRAANAPRSTRARWLCQCSCGKQVVIRGDVLRGGIKSCGCKNGIKHGACRGEKPIRLYNIWRDMKSRCGNPENIGYRLYGGRGITVCQEWDDFGHFMDWAMKSGYADNLTIDRIDPNSNYAPDNCRWVTNVVQQRNKRTTVFVTVDGVTHCIPEWAEILRVKKSALYKRSKDTNKIQEYIRSRCTNSQMTAGERNGGAK